MEFEVLEKSPFIAGRRYPHLATCGANLACYARQALQPLELLFEMLVISFPVDRQRERANLKLGAIDQTTRLGQAVLVHLLGELHDVEVDTAKPEGKRQLDQLALGRRKSQRVGTQILEHF